MTDEFEKQMQYLLDHGVKIDDLFKQKVKRQYTKMTQSSIKQIDPKTNIVIATYTSASHAYWNTGINQSTILKCLRDTTGRRKTAGGYFWRYVNND